MAWVAVAGISNEQVDDFGRRFKRRARFLIDESAGIEIARGLVDLGWNAVYAEEVGLTGRSDEEVFSFAWRQRRIIITHDRDFLDDRRFPLNRNPGVIVIPGANGEEQQIVTALAGILSLVGPFAGAHDFEKIEIAADRVWTVRGWDKAGGRHYRNRYWFKDGEIFEWREGA